MKLGNKIFRVGTSVLALMAATTTVFAQSALFEGDVISFGDSLTDNGNLSFLTGGLVPNTEFQGNNRFTTVGGLTFVEQLLGGVANTDGTIATSPQSVFFAGGGVTGDVNLGVGGALSGANGNLTNLAPAFGGSLVGPIPSIGDQINSFVAAGGVIDQTDTVTYLGGANDFFVGLGPAGAAAAASGSITPLTDVGAAIATSVIGDITTIADPFNTNPALNPGQIIVVNLPDLGLIPLNVGTPAQTAASIATSAFNQTLEAGVAQLAAIDTDTDFIFADIATVFDEIIANPAAFGFVNVTEQCFLNAECATAPLGGELQNSFLFADEVHPTNAGQALIAELVRQLVAPTIGGAAASGLVDAPIRNRQFVAGQALNRARSFFFQDAPKGASSTADVDTFDGSGGGKRSEGFIEAIAGTSTIAARGVTPEVESNLYGFRAGGDLFQSDSLVLGFQGSFITGEGSQPTLEFEPNSFAIDLYGAKKFGNAFAALTVGAARLDVSNIERSVGVGGLTNTADTDGSQFNVIGEIGYDLKVSGITIIPSGSIGFFRTDLDGYSEDGIFAPLAFGDRNINAVTGSVNVRAAKNFVTEGGLRGRVFAGVGYEDFLAYDANDLSVSALASTAAASTISIDDPDGRGFLFDVGARFDINDTFSVAADYTLGVGDGNTESHQGSFRLISRF